MKDEEDIAESLKIISQVINRWAIIAAVIVLSSIIAILLSAMSYPCSCQIDVAYEQNGSSLYKKSRQADLDMVKRFYPYAESGIDTSWSLQSRHIDAHYRLSCD